MTIKILNKKLNLSGYNNVILFSDSNINIKGLNTDPFKKFKAIIEKSTSLNKSNIKDFHSLDLSSSLKIIIVKINEDISLSKNNEKLGAKFYEYINSNSKITYFELYQKKKKELLETLDNFPTHFEFLKNNIYGRNT